MNVQTRITESPRKAVRPNQHKRNVLVVDDEMVMRDMMELVVTHLGYHPVVAANGEQALKMLAEIPIDLVISDIQMPGISGLELLRVIKTKKPEIPVLMMSGCNLETVQKSIRKYRADGFLPKPFSIHDLCDNIERVVK